MGRFVARKKKGEGRKKFDHHVQTPSTVCVAQSLMTDKLCCLQIIILMITVMMMMTRTACQAQQTLCVFAEPGGSFGIGP